MIAFHLNFHYNLLKVYFIFSCAYMCVSVCELAFVSAGICGSPRELEPL